jgi:type II secretory pathway component GspD/PulD (secretin)
MTRVLAALFVVAACTVFTLAEEEKPPVRFPFGPGQTNVPFELVPQDGKTAWKVSGKGNVRVEDLVGGLASAQGLRVSYSMAAAGRLRDSLPYVGPDVGVVIPHAELTEFASDLLSSAGLTIVGASTGKARVVRIEEAAGHALYVTEPELEKLPAGEWVMVRGAPRYASVETIAMVAQARTRADGGVQLRVETGAFVVTGMAGPVRTMLRLIRDADVPGAGDDGKLVRVYDLPGSAKAADAVLVIRALFDDPGQSVHNIEKNVVIQAKGASRVNAAALPANNRVVVRATGADHALVQAVIDAMK